MTVLERMAARRLGGRDVEFVYNHVVNPEMLIWLAEAAGAPRSRFPQMNTYPKAAEGVSIVLPSITCARF
jgi:hypothetical protein